ncbi:MAG: TolC family protein [Bacteroidales bacterium]|nr:TolC family protein [Candidatus Hennigimonas equi]
MLSFLTVSLAQQPDTLAQTSITAVQEDTSLVVLTLEDALKVAMSENIAVKIADKEIMRTTYAKKGAYAALFPNVDGSATFQRTIKKQVMYMDSGGGFDIGGMVKDALVPIVTPLYGQHPDLPFPDLSGGSGAKEEETGGTNDGFSVGRWNTWSAGVTASMPIINAQLWQSLKISGDEVELAVEKARGSRVDMVTQVKKAYYGVLLAKEANKVYEQVYSNAVHNLDITQKRYNAQKASEMELTRAKTTVANAVPDLYNSRNSVGLALWQLKAVMGVDLDYNMDVDGQLSDFADQMFYDIHKNDDADISRNSSLKQLAIQVEELAKTVKVNQMAYVPSLAVVFNYTYSAMTNDFNFKEYKWTPYSYVGLTLSIPIFSGGKRLNAVRQSRVQYDELKLQQVNLERQLRIGIRSCLSTMETSMNSYYAAQSAVESARKGYDISQRSYEVGRSTLVELNDALLALTSASLSECQAVYNFLSAKAELENQLGQDYIKE